MKTVKEIEAQLKLTQVPAEWIVELEKDERLGVKRALKRWYREYEKQEKERKSHLEKMQFDLSYQPFPGALVAGVDEAGRGPLAGPVVTAAVILPEECDALRGLDDSKVVSKEKRTHFATLIKDMAIAYSIHVQPTSIIDEINIYEATKKSMKCAVHGLKIAPDFVIVDAMALSLDKPTESIIKADAKSLAVAAASMLAKTTRDQYMEKLSKEFPMYQFDRNAGYGTATHLNALEQYGPCIHHRRSFEPVKSLLK